MRLKDKFFKPADRAQAQRDKIILYKKVFGDQEGREILIDLMNKYHILNSHKGDVFMEGQRSVVLDILSQCNIDIVQYDKIVRGELG